MSEDECCCQCHEDDKIIHCAPCCEGACPGCRRLIGLGRMSDHQKRCFFYQILKQADEKAWKTIIGAAGSATELENK